MIPTEQAAEFALFGERRIVRAWRDPATDLPVAEGDEGVMQAAVPQFLPAVTPLAEVILGKPVVWIRTEDQRLYIAPEQPGVGVNWGYSGSGPTTLAALLDRLLDDITAPAPSHRYRRDIPAGLLGVTGAAGKPAPSSPEPSCSPPEARANQPSTVMMIGFTGQCSARRSNPLAFDAKSNAPWSSRWSSSRPGSLRPRKVEAQLLERSSNAWLLRFAARTFAPSARC